MVVFFTETFYWFRTNSFTVEINFESSLNRLNFFDRFALTMARQGETVSRLVEIIYAIVQCCALNSLQFSLFRSTKAIYQCAWPFYVCVLLVDI